MDQKKGLDSIKHLNGLSRFQGLSQTLDQSEGGWTPGKSHFSAWRSYPSVILPASQKIPRVTTKSSRDTTRETAIA
jgi:hypothetical protein